MTCFEAWQQAKSAADQNLSTTLAGCSNDTCRDAAVAQYAADMSTADANYWNCRNSSGGGGGND